LVASAEQEAGLRALSRSDVRGEADRARAILLTLQGWTSLEVTEAFGVTPEAVRHWRGWFAERGVDALRSTFAPGPSPARGERALAVASLLLRQAQADAGGIALLYADESEALTHPYLAHAWVEQGGDLRVRAPGTPRKVAMMGARRGHGRTGCQHVPHQGQRRRGRALAPAGLAVWPPARLRPPACRAGAGQRPRPHHVHTSRATRAALAERPWIEVEWLPRYAPELNRIERTWHDLKRHHLAHHTFQDAAHLTCAIHAVFKQLNEERQTPRPCDKLNPCGKLNKAA